MKPSNLKLSITAIIMLLLSSLLSLSAKEIKLDKAIQTAKQCVVDHFPADNTLDNNNIHLQLSQKTDLPFFICNVDDKGFVLVAKDSKCPSVLAYSYESSFPSDLSRVPESFKAYIEAIKVSCNSYISGNKEKPSPSLKSNFIAPLMTTKWRVDSSFCSMFPEGSILNSSSVIAMGQVFRYFEKPPSGMGELCYLYGPNKEEICTEFGFMFNYSDMPDLTANEDVTTLLYFMAMAGRIQYTGTSLFTYAETLPEYFFYSDNMRELEYWEHDFIPILKHQLAMGRPIPADWEQSSFVIDGYYDTDFFHFNFGLGGELDGFYLMDFPNVTTDGDHFLLKCYVNYHPKSSLPIPTGIEMAPAGDSLNINWNIEMPDTLVQSFDRYILLRDGVIPILETTSTSVMVHPNDFGISSEISCIAVFNTLGSSELSEAYRYISDYTLADIPSLELRQEINTQLGYKENLNRIPYVGELELVKKLNIDFQDQRGIDNLNQLRYLFVDGILITGLSGGNYLNGLNYLLFHRCRQFDFAVFENTDNLKVIKGSDGLPYDFYDLRHNSNVGVISAANHDDLMNNCYDFYGIDKYFPKLTFFHLSHMDDIFYDDCFISYESHNDILPNIKGNYLTYEHTSPSSFAPCYPSPTRNSNVANTSQISWQANFDEAPNVFYNVYIGKTRDQLELIAPFYSERSFDYNFENNLDYYWRVEAFHADTTYYSGIYHFSTHESMPMPFEQNFDEYYENCDVAFESPWWNNFGDDLPEPTGMSRDIKRSGRYALEVLSNSDAGFIMEPYQDSSLQIEFYFQNNRSEFGIELLQGSTSSESFDVNSRIGLFGDNLGVFNHGEGTGQFLFTAFDWNLAQLHLDMPSGKGILTINGDEVSRWNWNVQLDGSINTDPFRGVRFANQGDTGSGLIDDIYMNFTKTTGINNIQNQAAIVTYSALGHELILEGDNSAIEEIDIFDLQGRKIITFACHGENRISLDGVLDKGVFIMGIRNKDGKAFACKISIFR